MKSRGQIVIFPYDGLNHGQKWKLQVSDKSILEPEDEDWQWRPPWQNYHNNELEFRRATTRSGRRYLGAHYITALLQTYRLKKEG